MKVPIELGQRVRPDYSTLCYTVLVVDRGQSVTVTSHRKGMVRVPWKAYVEKWRMVPIARYG